MSSSFKWSKYELAENELQNALNDFKDNYQNTFKGSFERALLYLPLTKESGLLFQFIKLVLKEMGLNIRFNLDLQATKDEINEIFIQLQRYVDKVSKLKSFI
jgi:hypothetical protein